MKGIKAHPAAQLMPKMSFEQRAELRKDIEKHGVMLPVVVCNGMILDGRHRWSICEELGIECPTTEYHGSDPTGYVASTNLYRRHLSKAQLALLGGRIKGRYAEEAKKRQAGGRGGVLLRANLPEARARARDKAADVVKVSGRSVDYGERVAEKGSDRLVAAVERGAVKSISAAAKVAELPKDEQDAALAAVESGEAKNLAQAIKAVTAPVEPLVTSKKQPATVEAKGNSVDTLMLGGASPFVRCTVGNDVIGYVAKHGGKWLCVAPTQYKSRDEAVAALVAQG